MISGEGCLGFEGFCPNAVDIGTFDKPESICGCDPRLDGSRVDAASVQALVNVVDQALKVANEAVRSIEQLLHPQQRSVLHRIPPNGSGLTPCCGRTLFELPRTDRTTEVPWQVTCKGARDAAP